MPIDPRLAALGNPVQGVDYAKIQGQALALNEAKAETERRAQAAKDEAAAKQASEQIRGLLKDSLMQDPETGVWTYDRAKIMPVLGVLPPEVAKALNDADASVLNAHKAQTDALKGIANLVDMTGNDPGFFDLELDRAEKNHQVSATMAKSIREQIAKDPSKVAYITGQLTGKTPQGPEEGVVVAPGATLAGKQTGKVLFQNPAKPGAPPNVGSFEDYVTRTYGENPTPAQILSARKAYGQADDRPSVNVSLGVGGAAGLTPDAVEYTATQYRVLGTQGIPTRLDNAQKTAIINAASRQAKDLGQSPAQAVQKQAAFKSDAASLTQMRKMASSAEAFENKALAQTAIIEELSPQVGRTASPLLNSALLAGKKELAGDSATSRLYNAIQTFSSEYAKIMEGSTGSVAASSDSARKASENLIKATMNPKTLSDVIGLMKREMQLTLDGYDVTINHITERMGGTSEAPASGGVTVTRDPKTGALIIKRGGV